MHRNSILSVLLSSLLATMASGQVSYTSQTRTIQAYGGSGSVTQSASAPDFGSWEQSVTSTGLSGSTSASQASSLGAGAATLSLSVSGSGVGPGSSLCTFTFSPSYPVTARLTSFLLRGGISITGPGVTVQRDARGSLSRDYDDSVTLQSGESYTVTSDASTSSGSATVSATLTFTPVAVPQSRSFTYQGVVCDALGQPISTPTDMEFRLLVRPEGGEGTQVGPTITADAVAVTSGLFTQTLDFGDVFDGNARWLEVSVRNPAGTGNFTRLTPRTLLNSSPYASFALEAGSTTWSGITGVPANVSGAFSPWQANGSSINYAGPVGVGTTATPGARFEVNAGATDGLLVRTSNSSPWALRIGNDIATAAGFQTGMFVTNDGFFRISNRIGNPNGTYAQLGTNGAWTALSDARLKTDVTNASGNLAAALKLRPVNFRWKSDGTEDFGLIAQEVRQILPRLVIGDETKDSLTLNYSQLSVVAIGAIQEQQRAIERLTRDNAELKARLERLEKALASTPAVK